MITTNQLTMRELYDDVQDRTTELVSTEQLVSHVASMLGRFTQIHDALESLEHGIEALVQGRITPNIVPFADLRLILKHADGVLRPRAQLCLTSVNDVYNFIRLTLLVQGMM